MIGTWVLYDAAEKPKIEGENASGFCWLCGELLPDYGIPIKRQIKATFNDRDLAVRPDATHVCPACAFSMSEASTLLAERVGKEKPQRMRNYSHFVVAGQWLPLSKGNKAQMAHLLLNGSFPQLAVVARSGQKHIVFRAQSNPGGGSSGWVQFEEQLLYVNRRDLSGLLQTVEELYSIFSKAEIEHGRYAANRIMKTDLDWWQERERVCRQWRGSPLFELSLFLAQRKELYDGEDRSRGRFASHLGQHVAGNMAWDRSNIEKPLSNDDLDTIRGEHSGGGLHQQPEQVSQLVLF